MKLSLGYSRGSIRFCGTTTSTFLMASRHAPRILIPESASKALGLDAERTSAKLILPARRLLDIGCWDGYWSFYAERRGASRVLANR